MEDPATAASCEYVLSDIGSHMSNSIQLRQIRADTCLRVTKQPFASAKREAPAYSRLVAISNKYGYIVTGTPEGISAFRTADAEDALVNGRSPDDDQPVELAKRNEISVGKVTHVALSADELSVIVALATGSIMIFPARELMEDSCSKTVRIISIHREIRDIRPNPLEMPMLVAVLTLGGAVLMVDIAQGTTKKITGDSNAKVTCICWSPRGKQIVCGDVDGMLTQRTPMDGVVQRVIHPAIGEKHPGSFAVLAVNWIKTYTFMAIYGEFPPGGFMAGHGGGGDGSTDDDDESGNIQTTAYVITQAGKQAPMHWRYIVDPCGAFEFPKRYPGFHFASINDWGKSAPHLQFLTSAGSAKVMTIAHCLPSMVEGERASGDVPDWCVLDTDPLYAQLPLAMVNTDESDTASVGMAIDFTSKRNLPPLSPEDSTEPVPPQPIMWILTTDGCLVGYYIYNTIEIEGGQQYAGMVKSVQALPGAAAGAAALIATASGSTAKVNEAPVPAFAKTGASGGAFSSILGDKPANGQGPSQRFGAAQGFMPSFGMSSSAAFGTTTMITPNPYAPTTIGIDGQRIFGQGMEESRGKLSFASLAEKCAGSTTSIFDQPTSGPSIFNQPKLAFGSVKEKKPSFWGEPVEVAPRTRKDEPALFAGAKSWANTSTSVSFGSAKQSISVTPTIPSGSGTTAKDMPVFSFSAAANTPVFAQVRKSSDSKAADTRGIYFTSDLAKQGESTKLPATEELAEAGGCAEGSQKQTDYEHRIKQTEKETHAAKEREEHQAELYRGIQRLSNDVISSQFVSAISQFDSELERFCTYVQQTRKTIQQVLNSALPPIEIDEPVAKLASATVYPESLKIGDADTSDGFANVLAKALLQACSDLKASHVVMCEEQAEMPRVDTRSAEIKHILASASSMHSAPNATIGGGANPFESEVRRRMRTRLITLRDDLENVRQLLEAQEAKYESLASLLGIGSLGTSSTSMGHEINSIAERLKKNGDVLDQLTKELDDIGIAKLSAAEIAATTVTAVVPTRPASGETITRVVTLVSVGGSGAAAVHVSGESDSGVAKTECSISVTFEKDTETSAATEAVQPLVVPSTDVAYLVRLSSTKDTAAAAAAAVVQEPSASSTKVKYLVHLTPVKTDKEVPGDVLVSGLPMAREAEISPALSQTALSDASYVQTSLGEETQVTTENTVDVVASSLIKGAKIEDIIAIALSACKDMQSEGSKALPESERVDITQQVSCTAAEGIVTAAVPTPGSITSNMVAAESVQPHIDSDADRSSAEDEIAEVADDNRDTTKPSRVDESVSEDASQLVDVSEAGLPSADNGIAEQTMSNIVIEADMDEAPPSEDFEFLSHPGSMGGIGSESQSDLRAKLAPAAVFGIGDNSSSLADIDTRKLEERGNGDEVSSITEKLPSPGVSPSPRSLPHTMTPVFRVGVFGNFGESFRSSTTAAATTQNTSRLPNAFASSVDKTALPVFGARLGKPAFGIDSMTQAKGMSKGTAGALMGSFASMSSGFGAASIASVNPMAKLLESSSEQRAFGVDAAAPLPQYSSLEIQSRKLTKATKTKTDDIDDPVRRMIEDSDCESDRESYHGYKSD